MAASPSARLAFGPVPSRRLGHSLGINNIPPKKCSYSCVYCQVGVTRQPSLRRCRFYAVEEIRQQVAARVRSCRSASQPIDYLTFVPDGEPTLDADLGDELEALRGLGIPLAVITNGSLLSRADVRADCARAHLVSVKVDSVDQGIWRRVDRPARGLELEGILAGIRCFAREHYGTLITETMLVEGFNLDPGPLRRTADFLAKLAPACAYLAVPTRPPADSRARPPAEAELLQAFDIFSRRLPRVELLVGQAAGSFGQVGDPIEDLLGILAVHPMRESEAREYLASGGASPEALDRLIRGGALARIEHRGRSFLVLRCATPSS